MNSYSRLQIQSVTALMALPPYVHICVFGQVYDFDHLCPQYLTSPSGWDVVRIACDPKGVQFMFARQREEQFARLCSVPVSSVFLEYCVSDVTSVHDDVVGVSHSYHNLTDLFILTGVGHFELVGWDIALYRVTPILLDQYQFEVIIN